MKFLIILACCLITSSGAFAQDALKYKPKPKAKQLDDSALKIFMAGEGDTKNYPRINQLLEDAVKIDPKYYEGWDNLMSFLGRTDQYEKCAAVAKRIVQQFPKEAAPLFNLGIMQYKTGHPKDAIATFEKLYKMYEVLLAKNAKSPMYNDLVTQKAIILILMDKPADGKFILRKLYDAEKDPYKKSYIAFYVNKEKAEIIDDRIPGK